MTRRLAWVAALAAAFALAACDIAGEPAKPPLWKVSGGGATVWLVGSMHLLPAGTDWRGDAIDHAIDTSGTLVEESDPTADQGFDAIAKDATLGPIAKRVDPAQADTLAKAIARTGKPADAFDGYKDWAAAVLLDVGDAEDAGADAKHGVDRALWDAFATKRRVALEPPGAQVRALDLLPAQLQRRMLGEAIAGPAYESVLAAWRGGDLDAIAKASGSKELRPFLVTAANRRWADWIAARMARKGILLIAVGAGHLAGKDSIVDLLKARGLTVERVQ